MKVIGMFLKENSEVESGAVEHAAASLANFALKHPRSRAEVVKCGGMPALVKLLNGSSSQSMLEKVKRLGGPSAFFCRLCCSIPTCFLANFPSMCIS